MMNHACTNCGHPATSQEPGVGCADLINTIFGLEDCGCAAYEKDSE